MSARTAAGRVALLTIPLIPWLASACRTTRGPTEELQALPLADDAGAHVAVLVGGPASLQRRSLDGGLARLAELLGRSDIGFQVIDLRDGDRPTVLAATQQAARAAGRYGTLLWHYVGDQVAATRQQPSTRGALALRGGALRLDEIAAAIRSARSEPLERLVIVLDASQNEENSGLDASQADRSTPPIRPEPGTPAAYVLLRCRGELNAARAIYQRSVAAATPAKPMAGVASYLAATLVDEAVNRLGTTPSGVAMQGGSPSSYRELVVLASTPSRPVAAAWAGERGSPLQVALADAIESYSTTYRSSASIGDLLLATSAAVNVITDDRERPAYRVEPATTADARLFAHRSGGRRALLTDDPGTQPLSPRRDCPETARTPAHIELMIASGYESFPTYLDGTPTTATGNRRIYTTPPLCPDRTYRYEAHLRWDDSRSRSRSIPVRAGEWTRLRLP